MNDSMHYRLSRATEDDAQFLTELFNDVRRLEFELDGLPAPMVDQLLVMQRRAQAISYAAQFPDAVDEIVWVEQERVGRVLVDTKAGKMCLVDIALLGRYRGRGVGTAILQSLCETANESGSKLHLSVRVGSRAAWLYERMGFVVIGGDDLNTQMEWRGKLTERIADEQDAEEQESRDVSQGYTLAYFRTLVGQRVAARTLEWPDRPASNPVELRVEAVERLKTPQGVMGVEVGDSFCIRLNGDQSELLPAETIEIRPAAGAPMAVFITPLGPEDGRMQYEVVFNRMEPPA